MKENTLRVIFEIHTARGVELDTPKFIKKEQKYRRQKYGSINNTHQESELVGQMWEELMVEYNLTEDDKVDPYIYTNSLEEFNE